MFTHSEDYKREVNFAFEMVDFDYLVNVYILYGNLDAVIEHQRNGFEPKLDSVHLIWAITCEQKHIVNYLLDLGIDVDEGEISDNEIEYINRIKRERVLLS